MAKHESTQTLHFTGLGANGAMRLDAPISRLIIAGWTGRDAAALEAHIVELEKLGVTRPRTVPVFYRAAASLLTQQQTIEVVGSHSSGEVEPVLFILSSGLWLGVGSDHTDRKLETVGVTISKQLCAKPIGLELWHVDDIDKHWDEIVIRSFAWKQGSRRLYQEGPLKSIRHPRDLISRCCGEKGLSVGSAMFCGTLPVRGEIEPSDSFETEIQDPVRGRWIKHCYSASELPIRG